MRVDNLGFGHVGEVQRWPWGHGDSQGGDDCGGTCRKFEPRVVCGCRKTERRVPSESHGDGLCVGDFARYGLGTCGGHGKVAIRQVRV